MHTESSADRSEMGRILTEADGEGDVREPCDTKSAPPRLTTVPLIDGFVLGTVQ